MFQNCKITVKTWIKVIYIFFHFFLGCIGHFNPKLITVRSKSGDLLSNDSSAVPIQGSSKPQRRTRVRISNPFQTCISCYLLTSKITIFNDTLIHHLVYFLNYILKISKVKKRAKSHNITINYETTIWFKSRVYKKYKYEWKGIFLYVTLARRCV